MEEARGSSPLGPTIIREVGMKNKKKSFAAVLFFVLPFISAPVFAEAIILKNGRSVEGQASIRAS